MMPVSPPKYALKFLRWFCREEYLEEFEGDLTEAFIKDYTSHPNTARQRFYGWVLRYFRIQFIKSSLFRPHNPLRMIRHNFKHSFRSFHRNKTAFVVNLVGLSTGLACTLLIYLWVADEYQTDRLFANSGQLYQVMKTSFNVDGTVHTHETTPSLLAGALAEEFPEVEYATNVFNRLSGVVFLKEKRMKARVAFAGKDFFKVFSLPLAAANRQSPLSDKYSIYISSGVAQGLFGSKELAVGKVLNWAGEDLDASYTVAGVFEEPPHNASMQFDVLFSYSLFYDTFKDRRGLDKWHSNTPSTYVMLKKGTDVTRFNKKIADFAKRKYAAAHGEVSEYEGIIYLQGYADKYLHGNYENGVPAGGRIDYVKVLSSIAVFVLLIACINFMNLSTAQATRRMKEVGVMKVVGASRGQLISQYITESVLLTMMSMLVAILVVALLLPSFNALIGKKLSLTPDTHLVLAIFGTTFCAGILAGTYPAFILSRFNPSSVLKGIITTYKRNVNQAFLRKGLVAFQLTVSLVLITSVLVIYSQIDFIQSRNLGFNKNNVITFPVDGEMRNRLSVFMTELRRIPGVVSASGTMGDLVGLHSGGGGVSWPGKPEDYGVEFAGIDVDEEFALTMGIETASGRFFKAGVANEVDKVIFNKAAIEAMQLKDPIGQTVTMWGREKQIIGIVDNFHFESMYKAVGPFFLRYNNEKAMSVFVKLQNGLEQEVAERIAKHYQQFNAGLPFEYHFIDDDFRELYSAELQVSTLSRYFSGIAIIISCLGLFALASFSTTRRIKEIGIRKALGSGEWRIVRLLTSEFTWMALISLLIAVPLSYYLAGAWLNKFAYHISLQPWHFAAGAVSMLLVTWATVGLHTIKASRINPATSLRHE